MYLFTLGFFSRICDKRFGGTYMTMLSTIASFGWVFSNTLALRMIDVLSFSKCSNNDLNNCSTIQLKNVRNIIVIKIVLEIYNQIDFYLFYNLNLHNLNNLWNTDLSNNFILLNWIGRVSIILLIFF